MLPPGLLLYLGKASTVPSSCEPARCPLRVHSPRKPSQTDSDEERFAARRRILRQLSHFPPPETCYRDALWISARSRARSIAGFSITGARHTRFSWIPLFLEPPGASLFLNNRRRSAAVLGRCAAHQPPQPTQLGMADPALADAASTRKRKRKRAQPGTGLRFARSTEKASHRRNRPLNSGGSTCSQTPCAGGSAQQD